MKRSDTHAHSKMSEDYLAKVEKLSREDLKRRHPNSPCYSCQFFRKLDLIGGSWVFKLPNPPNFADRETLHAWCLIEVLDRYPAPLYEGKACPYWESREVPVTITYEHIKALHPANLLCSKEVKEK